jgi:hypothetical protein
VQVPFSAGQTQGNLNVVIVGWNDTTAAVTSVGDSNLNAYQLAVGPTQLTAPSGNLSQAIYYAKNVSEASGGSSVF